MKNFNDQNTDGYTPEQLEKMNQEIEKLIQRNNWDEYFNQQEIKTAEEKILQEMDNVIAETLPRKTYNVIVYRQGSAWISSDGCTEPLPYFVQTKQQVRKFLQDRLDDKYPGVYKLRVTWA